MRNRSQRAATLFLILMEEVEKDWVNPTFSLSLIINRSSFLRGSTRLYFYTSFYGIFFREFFGGSEENGKAKALAQAWMSSSTSSAWIPPPRYLKGPEVPRKCFIILCKDFLIFCCFYTGIICLFLYTRLQKLKTLNCCYFRENSNSIF